MPDNQDQNFGWTIKRASADGPAKLVILNSDMLGIRTHFFRGRTIPCLLEDCPACECKQLSRWKGYLLAIEIPTEQQVVFEFTPPVATTLDEAHKRHGTMRGLQVVVSRTSKKANGKVVLAVKGITVLGPQACPDYSVWPILCRIWGIAGDDVLAITKGDLKDLSEWESFKRND
jgi:hypothetical protein